MEIANKSATHEESEDGIQGKNSVNAENEKGRSGTDCRESSGALSCKSIQSYSTK